MARNSMKIWHKRYLMAAVAWAVMLAVIGLAAWFLLLSYSARSSRNLRADAYRIANGAPFCVQVAGPDDVRGRSRQVYRPVVAPDDTTLARMVGHGGHHHAVLVVEEGANPRTYHWSYFKQRFIEGTYGPFPIVCDPSRRYFEEIRNDAASPVLTFSLRGRRLSIPWAYQPVPEWPGSMVGYSLSAASPDFLPVGEGCRYPHCPSVRVAFERDGKAYGIVQNSPVGGTPQSGALEGLLHDNAAMSTSEDYVRIDERGKIVADITCMRDCLHRFSEDGLTFSFHHAREDLPAWRTMQQRLLALHRQFEQ